MMWADAMRVQVLALHTTLQGVMADESPFKPLALTRCRILLDYIDDLEAGRMPQKERPAGGSGGPKEAPAQDRQDESGDEPDRVSI